MCDCQKGWKCGELIQAGPKTCYTGNGYTNLKLIYIFIGFHSILVLNNLLYKYQTSVELTFMYIILL